MTLHVAGAMLFLSSGALAANPVAVFDTTMGSFKAELYLDRVPRTASNFIDLAKTGFYDGLHFHRVIPGFMNQAHIRSPCARCLDGVCLPFATDL